MNLRTLAVAVLLLCLASGVASGQTLNARRMSMGGVLLPEGGPASDAINVAYRAVPAAPGSSFDLPLPIGLIPLFTDPPVFDPKDEDFNVYDLANKLYQPPWNLQLVEPPTPSSDIVVTVGRDYLALELGDIADALPDDRSRFGGVTHLPAFGVGFRQYFANVSAVTHIQNQLDMNDPLLRSLKDGQPFQPNTEYALDNDARAQAAAALQLGWAGAVSRAADHEKTKDRSGLYLGVRARAMRGLAYGDAQHRVGFTTRDTLFSSSPIDLDVSGHTRTAAPSDGGMGQGFDLGAVWIARGFEIGVGANDLGSRLRWKVEESVVARDSATGDLQSTVIARDVSYTSELPPSYSVTLAKRFGGTLVAADAVRGVFDTTVHLGAERWVGPIALRCGGSLDGEQIFQYGGGVGARLGRFGVDAGVATNSRNLSHERGVELGLGLALYH